MKYQCSLIILINILCANGKHWYLASSGGNVMDLSQGLNQKLNKTKRFSPRNIEQFQNTMNKSNNIKHSYFNSNLVDFKPSDTLQMSNMFKTIGAKVKENELKSTYLALNNTIENNDILKFKCPKQKILRRRCKRKSKYRKRLNLNATIQSRFLEVFEVVEFDHVICSSGTGLEGRCLHEYDCKKIGGITMGTCADGYGTCCVILFTCDARSSSATGWFTNPGYPDPSSDRLSCTFTLDKHSDQVKQLRLDFMNFEILPPTAGTCKQDQFLVTGQNVNSVIPILCGINTGQHAYIEVSEAEGPIVFSFQTITEEKRLFSIKVTQITSVDKLKAPSGCLQYFKGDHGYIESFNYREASEIGIARTPSYLNNLNYAICIERASSSCSITYTNAGDLEIVNYDSEGLPITPPRQAGVEIFDCPSDWLLISAIRLCGERLNDGSILQDFTLDAPVTDDGNGPIAVWFRSDGIYSGRGFKLYYQQNSCIN